MLSVVGLDMREFYTLYGKEKLLGAILYAKELKDRYTVLWLYYDYFGAEEGVRQGKTCELRPGPCS